MQHLILENRTYTGFEVALPMMRKSEDNTEYKLVDRVESVRERADLLIIRDVMQHWPAEDIEYVVEFFMRKFKYAFLTNDHIASTKPLKDIKPGGYRPINLGVFPDLEEVLAVDFNGNVKVSYLYTGPGAVK